MRCLFSKDGEGGEETQRTLTGGLSSEEYAMPIQQSCTSHGQGRCATAPSSPSQEGREQHILAGLSASPPLGALLWNVAVASGVRAEQRH